MTRDHTSHRPPSSSAPAGPPPEPTERRPQRPSAPRTGEAEPGVDAEGPSIEGLLEHFLAEPRLRHLYERLTRRTS